MEKSYTKYGRETISRLFSKKSKLSIFLGQMSKILYTKTNQDKDYQNILKLSCKTLTFISYKAV